MAEALLSSAASVLLNEAQKMVDRGLKHKSTAQNFMSTQKELSSILDEIEELARMMDLSDQETENLQRLITETQEAHRKCTKIGWWNCCVAPCYQQKLEKVDKSLEDFISHYLLLQTASTVKELRRPRINTAGQTDHIVMPETTLELNSPLMNKLKNDLMKDDGDPVLNLCGFSGTGKTTLAKQLCRDLDVRGWFNDNIRFVSVGSKKESNEDLAEQLEDELRERWNKKAVLLVLDDVDPGSNELVERCWKKISSNSKSRILVTSRDALPGLGKPVAMPLLSEDDALNLFRHIVQQNGTISHPIPDDHILRQVVKDCGGLPLAIKLMGAQLRGKPIEFWLKTVKERSRPSDQSAAISELLILLQNSLSVSKDFESTRKFFMDLGLFPQDVMIPVAALVDLWTELHKLDEAGLEAMINVYHLTDMNLADKVVDRRLLGRDEDKYYNNHFVTQSNLLRKLAIHMSKEEPLEKRKRLIIDVNGNRRPEWWPQKKLDAAAHILSISTDQHITPDWCNIKAADAEALVLNLKTAKYKLPKFIGKMKELKVLIVTNYGFHPAELSSLRLLGSLPHLRRIRLQQVSFPSLCYLKNVHKFSFYMCKVKKAFEDNSINFSKSMPNLVDLNFDYCKDLEKLPYGLCDVITLKNLSISSCHKFVGLPLEIWKLENLELLRISCCSNFEEMPASISKLKRLNLLDISCCPSLRKLPDEIGELHKLTKLYMTGCPINELPFSVLHLEHLEKVICDEYTYPLWEVTKSSNSKPYVVSIETADTDANLDWLSGLSSQDFIL